MTTNQQGFNQSAMWRADNPPPTTPEPKQPWAIDRAHAIMRLRLQGYEVIPPTPPSTYHWLGAEAEERW